MSPRPFASVVVLLVFSALLASAPARCLAGDLWVLSADATRAVQVRMGDEEMEITCQAVDELRREKSRPLLMEKVSLHGSQPEPCILWSPDSRCVVMQLSYNKGASLRAYRFDKENTAVAVDMSAVDKACPDLGHRLAATAKGKEADSGRIDLSGYHVAWTKDGSLMKVKRSGMAGAQAFVLTLDFNPETDKATNVKLQIDGVTQKPKSE